MLSNQVLQRAVSEMEAIAGGACSVWSLDGYRIVLSGSESEGTAERVKRFLKDVKEDSEPGMEEIRTGYALFAVFDEEKPAYILSLENMSGEKAEIVGLL